MTEKINLNRKRVKPGLSYLVKWIERAIRVELDAGLRPLGFTTPEYTALSVLRDGRELSSAQLARRTFVSAQATHPIVTRLEARKLVSRRPHPEGGRAYLVSLTERGSAALAACDRACADTEERSFTELSRSEREALRSTLAKCAAAMTRARNRKEA